MSEQSQPESQYPQIQIVHHADGTAEVNGVPVHTGPDQHVRDAAYAAAVALVAHCPEPVVATSIEADGSAYRLTLYPRSSALAAGEPEAADGIRASIRRAVRLAGDRGRGLPVWRAGRGAAAAPSRLPVLRLGWLLTAVIGCVLVAAMAAVLMERGGTSLVRLSVQQQKEAPASDPSPDAASPATAAGTAGGALGSVARGVAGIARPGDGASAAASAPVGAPGSAATTTAPAALPGPPGDGTSQAPGGQPGASRPAHPNPTPGGSFRVELVTLALLGGDRKNPSITYVVTVSANGPNPVTLTYTYSGSKSKTAVTRSITLSGEREYAVTGEIPGRSYCGQSVSVRAWTSPAAATGTVRAVTTPGC